jgi:hypothetical protein
MDKRFVAIVTKTTSKTKTSVGSAGRTNLTTVTKCRSGGAVARKEKNQLDVSSLSMSVRMMKTQMILKRRRNRCRNI